MTDPAPATVTSQYRQLDAARILATLERLRNRITERFPESGLSRVATELITVGADVTVFVQDVQRPHWPSRVGAGVAIVGMVGVVLVIANSLRLAPGVDGLADLIQAADAAISTLVFLGATIFFLWSLANRLKRRRALLADPTRRKLLDLLHRESGQTLSALSDHLDMTRQAVTQHLRQLEDANLVAVVWRGRKKLHYLNAVPLHEIHARWIEKFEHPRLGALRNLKKKLEPQDE